MNEPHDPNQTADVPSVEADSLDAGLAAGFGRPADGPGSVLSGLRKSLGDLRPVLLREAQGESAHIVKPKSDAMPTPEQTGDRYQLSGEIARGGMGVVLRGRDVDLGRDLAVKVLLEKYADRPEVARRFIEEAQIGGQLQHPGVVPVYDIGCFAERPFFTMKLVKGKTLAALLSERTDLAADRPRLLAIAVQVGQTLAYAHAKGVIHRDLKPANIMVGSFGEVQVMDWGLAKVLAEGGVADEERASRQHQEPIDVTTIRTARSSGSAGSGTDTEAGSLLGTPAYMPPEQANGDVALLDRRADVFGLGAILCEILTGKTPYVGRSYEEVRRKAANGDLADAFARLDGCGADPELIVLTKACLSPEAIDRPKDAQAVAEGLTAYLDGVQQRLHQAELAEAEARAKAVEEAKRRRLTLALAGTVLLALTLGGGSWLYLKTQRDARQAEETRAVNEALNKVTALREQARTAVVGSSLLFAQAREQAQRALALVESGPADDTLKTLVRQVQTELDEEEKDRRLVAALDEARLAQAETMAGVNRFAPARAVPKFREAFRAYGLAAGEGEPKVAAERIRRRPAAVRAAILAALDEWDHLADNPKSEFERHLENLTPSSGTRFWFNNPEHKITEPHREWLRAVLDAADPDDVWGRKVRAARRETDAVKRQAALEALAKSAKVAELPALALTRLADALSLPQAAELLRRSQRHYPADFWVNEKLGEVLREVTPPEREEAVRFLTAAVALRPESPGAHYNLSLALADKGQLDEAIASCKKAIELDPVDPIAHDSLGLDLWKKEDLDGAEREFREAARLDGEFHGFAIDHLADLLASRGNLDGAVAVYQEFFRINPKDALAYAHLGRMLYGKGQVDEAITSQKKAIALDPKLAVAHYYLGVILWEKEDLDGAEREFRAAVRLDGGRHGAAIKDLVELLVSRGNLDRAIAVCKELLQIMPKNAEAYSQLGFMLYRAGQVDEAITSQKKAIALDPNFALAHYYLGRFLWKKEDLDGAEREFREAVRLDSDHHGAAIDALTELLVSRANLDGAVAVYQEFLRINPKDAAAQSGLAQVQRLAAVQGKLAAFLNGDFKPSTNDERLSLSELCRIKKLYRTSAGLYADAFAADPKLADDLKASHRYNAACYAALAAAGQGEDTAKLDAKERARLRKQALDWLRADLALRTKQLESGQAADRTEVQQQMKHWQQDGDLAGIRDEKELAKLPADERQTCEKLWADVAALLKKAGQQKK